jgi:hypothetical protein
MIFIGFVWLFGAAWCIRKIDIAVDENGDPEVHGKSAEVPASPGGDEDEGRAVVVQ